MLAFHFAALRLVVWVCSLFLQVLCVHRFQCYWVSLGQYKGQHRRTWHNCLSLHWRETVRTGRITIQCVAGSQPCAVMLQVPARVADHQLWRRLQRGCKRWLSMMTRHAESRERGREVWRRVLHPALEARRRAPHPVLRTRQQLKGPEGHSTSN